MIALVSGCLLDVSERRVTVLTPAGWGLEVEVGATLAGQLTVGEAVRLWTRLHVGARDATLHLHGFREKAERDLFDLLCSIPGVGARVAHALLDTFGLGVEGLLWSEDVDALTQVPGIGLKKARALLIEVRPLLEKRARVTTVAGEARHYPVEVATTLRGLGFEAGRVQQVLGELAQHLAPNSPAENWLQAALQMLGGS